MRALLRGEVDMFDGPGILLALAAVVGPLACAWWLIGACAPTRSRRKKQTVIPANAGIHRGRSALSRGCPGFRPPAV